MMNILEIVSIAKVFVMKIIIVGPWNVVGVIVVGGEMNIAQLVLQKQRLLIPHVEIQVMIYIYFCEN